MAKLPKKPKKPKASASVASWEKFAHRVSEWHKKINSIKAGKNKKAALIKKFSSF